MRGSLWLRASVLQRQGDRGSAIVESRFGESPSWSAVLTSRPADLFWWERRHTPSDRRGRVGLSSRTPRNQSQLGRIVIRPRVMFLARRLPRGANPRPGARTAGRRSSEAVACAVWGHFPWDLLSTGCTVSHCCSDCKNRHGWYNGL